MIVTFSSNLFYKDFFTANFVSSEHKVPSFGIYITSNGFFKNLVLGLITRINSFTLVYLYLSLIYLTNSLKNLFIFSTNFIFECNL